MMKLYHKVVKSLVQNLMATYEHQKSHCNLIIVIFYISSPPSSPHLPTLTPTPFLENSNNNLQQPSNFMGIALFFDL
jgi:hypothetical protein